MTEFTLCERCGNVSADPGWLSVVMGGRVSTTQRERAAPGLADRRCRISPTSRAWAGWRLPRRTSTTTRACTCAKPGEFATRTVQADLSPHEDAAGNIDPSYAVETATPFASPWRVLMIADEPGKLIESNIVLNLNPPSKIADTSGSRRANRRGTGGRATPRPV